jgi:N-acyl homoserine lactone hydrolase
MNTPAFEILLDGAPVTSDRGFAGVSTITLVTSGRTRVLVDTGGIGDRVLLLNRLEDLGLGPDDIDVVVLTHLHFDHAGNVELFDNAVVVVHALEMAHGRQNPRAPGYSQQITAALTRHPRLSPFDTPSLSIAPGVSVIHTPGHTPGSVSVRVDGDTPTFIVGDALKHRHDIRSGTPSGPNTDLAAWTRAAKHILERASYIVPGHDSQLEIRGSQIIPLSAATSPFHLAAGFGSDDATHADTLIGRTEANAK